MDYVRVVCDGKSTNVDLDGKIRTYSDVVKAAATDFFGKRFPAEVPIGDLSLRGPVAATDDFDAAVLTALQQITPLFLGRKIDETRTKGGAWFLLNVERADPPRGACGPRSSPRSACFSAAIRYLQSFRQVWLPLSQATLA